MAAEMIFKTLALIMTALEGIRDLRTGGISPAAVACFAVPGACFKGMTGEPLFTLLSGMIPGMILMGTAFVTRDKLGYGDGILYLGIGLLVGLYLTLVILFVSLLLAGTTGMILMAFGKLRFKDSLPFGPFTAVACLGVICI